MNKNVGSLKKFREPLGQRYHITTATPHTHTTDPSIPIPGRKRSLARLSSDGRSGRGGGRGGGGGEGGKKNSGGPQAEGGF